MTTPTFIRTALTQDNDAIRELTQLAFEGRPYASGTESLLAEKLEKAVALTESLVAEDSEHKVVGHLALSPVTVNGDIVDAYGIGPVAVHPDHQGQGIGTQLLNDVLKRLKVRQAQCVVLVGDPNYYSRVGFQLETGLFYRGAPAAYFQAIHFSDESLEGEVKFHPAFDDPTPKD